MATVVVFPLPADELGPLEPLVAAVGFQWKVRCGFTRLLRNHALNYIYYSGSYGAHVL